MKTIEVRLCLVKKTPRWSNCCRTKIIMSVADGIVVGSCAKCGKNVVRLNPRTGKQEWLHGVSAWSLADAME